MKISNVKIDRKIFWTYYFFFFQIRILSLNDVRIYIVCDTDRIYFAAVILPNHKFISPLSITTTTSVWPAAKSCTFCPSRFSLRITDFSWLFISTRCCVDISRVCTDCRTFKIYLSAKFQNHILQVAWAQLLEVWETL